jgi:hypothetical protein
VSEQSRRAKKDRRRSWRQRDFIKLGHMLAEGRPSAEIAEALKMPDGRVRAVVRRAGMAWLRQPGQHEYLHIGCSRSCLKRLRLAGGLDLSVDDMLSRLVAALSTERDATLIRNLIDEDIDR